MPFESNLDNTDYTCPTCGGDLDFDPSTDTHYCRACEGAKIPEEFEENDEE